MFLRKKVGWVDTDSMAAALYVYRRIQKMMHRATPRIHAAEATTGVGCQAESGLIPAGTHQQEQEASGRPDQHETIVLEQGNCTSGEGSSGACALEGDCTISSQKPCTPSLAEEPHVMPKWATELATTMMQNHSTMMQKSLHMFQMVLEVRIQLFSRDGCEAKEGRG